MEQPVRIELNTILSTRLVLLNETILHAKTPPDGANRCVDKTESDNEVVHLSKNKINKIKIKLQYLEEVEETWVACIFGSTYTA